jgi:hypothetical protein
MKMMLPALLLLLLVGPVMAQEESVSPPKWAFDWREGDWWVLTYVAVPPIGLEFHRNVSFQFYFTVSDTTQYCGQEAFIVDIYCRNKQETEQYLAQKENQGKQAWPEGIDRCSKEDLASGFPLVAKLYIDNKNYSPLAIEYSDCMKRRQSERSLKEGQEHLKNESLLRIYLMNAKSYTVLRGIVLCYPRQEDLVSQLIIRSESENSSDPCYRRYLLLEDEPWVHKQEDFRKDHEVDRFTTKALVFISECSRNGQHEPAISLNPSVKPKNLRKTLSRQTDKQSIDIFRIGSDFEQVDLSTFIEMITPPHEWHPSAENISSKSLSTDTKKTLKYRQRLEMLLAQEPPVPEDEGDPDGKSHNRRYPTELPSTSEHIGHDGRKSHRYSGRRQQFPQTLSSKSRRDSKAFQDSSEIPSRVVEATTRKRIPDWLVAGSIAVVVVLAGVVAFLLVWRRRK